MSNEKTLLKRSLLYSIGNFAPKALGFILIPLYTCYLSPEEFGAYEIIIVTVSLLSPFISMGIESAIYRYALDESRVEDIGSVLSNGYWVVIRNLLIFDVIYFFVAQTLEVKYLWYLLALLNLTLICGLLRQTARSLGKITLFSLANVFNVVVLIGLNLYLIIYVGLKVEALLISNIAAQIAQIIVLISGLRILSLLKFSSLESKVEYKFLRYSLPLILSVAFWWIIFSSDRYLITYFCGLKATGLYSIANKFPSLLLLVYTSFALSWQDTAIALYDSEEKDAFYSKVFNKLAILLISTAIVLIFLSKILLQLLVDKKFHSAWVYVPFLYLATVSYIFCSFYSVGFHGSKKTLGSCYTAGFGALLNIVCNLIFIPMYGVHGAVFATLLSFVVVWIARVYWTRDFFRISIEWSKFLSLSLLALFAAILTCFYQDIAANPLFIVLSLLIFIHYNFSLIKRVSFIVIGYFKHAA